MKKEKIVVASGWWCDEIEREWLIGDMFPKRHHFFKLWYYLVQKYIHPDFIFITDSHSPIKPEKIETYNLHWLELDKNYGHANDIRLGLTKTKYCGFTRSVIMGAAYALSCDADYYVYLEQDCVIHGEGFLEAAIAGKKEPILYGDRTAGLTLKSGQLAAPMYQQSLIIVRKDGIEKFVSGILNGTKSDGAVSPEKTMELYCKPAEILAIPYGRSKPVDFSSSHFYCTCLSANELQEFLTLEKIDGKDLLSGRNGPRLMPTDIAPLPQAETAD